jgi:GT2 family glycosyltransferase
LTRIDKQNVDDLVASVIVPARNSGEDLRGLLDALARQTIGRDRFEIIIGDDGSTDGSTEGLSTDDGWLQVVRGRQESSDAARNRAARSSHAPVLAFCDADCLPEPDWLDAGLKALIHADLAGGLILRSCSERPGVWTLLDIDTFIDQEHAVRQGFAMTGNLFVRRDVFEQVGGFDDTLHYWGDFDFVERCVKSGARLVLAREAVSSHPTYDSARPFLRKVWSVNYAYAFHQARAGKRPSKLRLREWIPILQPLRSRFSSGRPIGIDRCRLETNGIRPRLRHDLLAAPVMYILMPYLAIAAQASGWWNGRRA